MYEFLLNFIILAYELVCVLGVGLLKRRNRNKARDSTF